jgi:hypothetical protein
MRCNLFLLFLIMIGSLAAQQKHDVVINEVLFNPKPGGADYVELYNRSNKAVQLKNLLLASKNTYGQLAVPLKITSGEQLILPEEYLAITQDRFATTSDYTIFDSARILEVARLPPMPDDEGIVVLLNTQGTVLDELHYYDDWHFSLLNNKDGVSLERLNIGDSTNNPLNWHSASSTSGYGTPGYKNSQFYVQQQMQERFTIAPALFSPDNDGIDDFTTIDYQFPEPGYVVTLSIFDAAGRLVKTIARNVLCGPKGYFRWSGLDEHGNRLTSGIYVLLIDCFTLHGKRLRVKKTMTLVSRY